MTTRISTASAKAACDAVTALLNSGTVEIRTGSQPATVATVDSHTATTTAVTVWLSGGTSGTRGTIACHITTSAGRQDVRTITVDATDR